MSTDAHAAPRSYPWRMRAGWWTRKGHYFWYVVREFTSLPLALWLLWLLYDISRRQLVAQPAFLVFSIVCLPFALYHSITFSALAREESRGAHARVDFTERDDARFLKHTVAFHTNTLAPRLEYRDVTITSFKPQARTY